MNRDPDTQRRKVSRHRSVPEDVDRELRAHLEMRSEELIAMGWEPSAARKEAERVFGSREAVANACRKISTSRQRAARRAGMFDAVWQDVKFGFRVLRRSPGFAMLAIATLALGIGANTAIFSVVNGVMLQPLPFEQPDRLAWISERNNRGGTMSVAWANFMDWTRESSSFEALTAYGGTTTTTVLGAGQPLRVVMAQVSEDFWRVFPVRPVVGRLTTASDHVAGAEAVLVVSNAFWQNQLGGRDLDGLVLEVGTSRASVVGVTPDSFEFPNGVQAWGAAEQVGSFSESRTAHNWRVVGRLASGVTLAQAQQEIDALTRTIVQREPGGAGSDYLATGALTVSLLEQVVGDSRVILWLLWGAAGMVLLVACTNLASTLLARGTHRARELAVRASLGAEQGRIVRQLLTESVVLAGLGGVAGVGLAVAVVHALTAFGAASVPRIEDVGIDGWVLLYSGCLVFGTALLFGLLPAVRLTGGETGEALRTGSRGNAGDYRGRIWRGLVGTEVALAVVLLVGSGLLVRSFRTLLAEDPGFDAADVTTIPMSLPGVKYQTADEHARLYGQLLRELESSPGVSGVAVSTSLPMKGFLPNGQLELDGNLDKLADGHYVLASGGLFEALDVPLIMGRTFDDRDTPDSPHVAIVSASFARRYWPGEDAIGHQVTGGGMDNFWEERRFAEVVGVVGDVRYRDLSSEPQPKVYFPYSQRPFRMQYGGQLVVESSDGDPTSVVGTVRAAVERIEPDIPVEFATQTSLVGESLAERRFTMSLLGGFSLIALMLAGVGVYGVVSYTVARRTREMGIRLALGAPPAGVLRLIVSGSMRPVLGGVIAGVAVALVGVRALESLLYGVDARDPLTFLGVVVVLSATGLLASWIPARMGMRVDPNVTMRAE